jgi:hypothetical protein
MGWLSSITSPVASLAGAAIGAFSARSTNRAASAQAARSMEFEERLSKTAHQRQVADMRAAGLNPILSATGGSGASTPSGKAAPVIDPAATATKSAATAMQAKRMIAEINQIEALTNASYAQEHKTNQETKLIQAAYPEAKANAQIYDSDFGTLLKGGQAIGKSIPFSAKGIFNDKKKSKNVWNNPKLNKYRKK